MKTSNLQSTATHPAAIIRGWVDGSSASTDAGTTVIQRENAEGSALAVGDVVVLNADGTITTTTTAEDPRPTGVVLDDIDDGATGPVAWQGPVDVINLTASGAAGEYVQTSITAGEADSTATKGSNSFGYLTGSGTTPSAFLFGSGGSSGLDLPSILDAAAELFLTNDSGERHVPETISAGAAETLDLSTANTFDVTLTDDLTITLSNPPASGVEGRWTIVLRQDGTGGWTVTWPASVVWRDTDGTQTATPPTLATAADAVDTIDLRTLDGGATYGASLENGSGAGGAASPLTTKGDLWGYDTADARVPVGTNGYVLTADSTDAQGVVWADPQDQGHYEVLMDGSGTATPLEDGSGTDWLYVWVA